MGLTQQAFAEKLGYSLALVSAVERCRRSPTADFAARCDEVTDAPGTFKRWQVQVSRESYPAFFAPVLAFERDAVRIHAWEIGAVPGLCQTEDYARALIRASRSQDSDDAVERMVTARAERQAILAREHPPALWFVLDEGILHRVVGSRSVMADQLDKLITLASLPGVVIQVLPYAIGDHAGTDGPISVFEFQDTPTVCYTECYGGGRIIEGRDEVAELVTGMGMLRASALSPRETLELIRKMRSEIDG
jgi:transcriptional regulator with XRE-family HTH domain